MIGEKEKKANEYKAVTGKENECMENSSEDE